MSSAVTFASPPCVCRKAIVAQIWSFESERRMSGMIPSNPETMNLFGSVIDS